MQCWNVEKKKKEENDGVPEGNVDRKGGVAKSDGKGIGEWEP